MAGLPTAAGARGCIQPAHHRSRAADFPAAAIVWVSVEPTHRQRYVAGFPALAVRVCFRLGYRWLLWPICVQQLSLDVRFDRPMVRDVWPASLQLLSFAGEIDRPIIGAVSPVSLQELYVDVARRHTNRPIVVKIGLRNSCPLQREFGRMY